MLDFQKFFQGDEDEDAGEGEKEGWKEVTKEKVEEKNPGGPREVFIKVFQEKKTLQQHLWCQSKGGGMKRER